MMMSEESPIEERLRLLQGVLSHSEQRAQSQRDELARLRSRLSAYSETVQRIEARAGKLEAAPAAAPVAIPEPAPLPTVSGRRWPAWAKAVPYAAIVALGLALSLDASPRAVPRAPLPDLPLPAPDAATEQPLSLASEEDGDTDTLSLVYAYVPPGGRRSVREALQPEIETTESSAWVIVRVDARTTLVSFRPYGDALEAAPVYEFVVDPVSRAVRASPETLQSLRGNALAAR